MRKNVIILILLITQNLALFGQIRDVLWEERFDETDESYYQNHPVLLDFGNNVSPFKNDGTVNFYKGIFVEDTSFYTDFVLDYVGLDVYDSIRIKHTSIIFVMMMSILGHQIVGIIN